MRIRDHPNTPAALVLAGIAAFHGLLVAAAGGWPQPASFLAPAQRPLPPPGSNARKSLEWCRHNVMIIHDVYWASACTVVAEEERRQRPGAAEPPDDSPDCTLPDAVAAPLNSARARADQQCLDEALASAPRVIP